MLLHFGYSFYFALSAYIPGNIFNSSHYTGKFKLKLCRNKAVYNLKIGLFQESRNNCMQKLLFQSFSVIQDKQLTYVNLSI